MTASTTIQALFKQAELGDPAAVTGLFAALYDELHGLAQAHVRRAGGGVSLTPTALLHEAYLVLSGRDVAFPDQPRFLGYAAKVMRTVVIDHYRARQAHKRGSDFEITGIRDDQPGLGLTPDGDLDQLRDALEALNGIDPELGLLVDLHFFCGFSFVELAAMHGVSERTVQRQWRAARMLLHRLVVDG